jgi:NADH-quinone oxidoreductase subunit J
VIGIIAGAAVLGLALVVVTSRDLVRAVLALGGALAGTAILYAVLDAPYLVAAQLLLYVGGVVTVLVFGVLLTRRPENESVTIARGRSWPGLVAALGFAVPVVAAILRTAPAPEATAEPTASIGLRFVTEHVLAFEALSAVLLAAMVGAIVLARRGRP